MRSHNGSRSLMLGLLGSAAFLSPAAFAIDAGGIDVHGSVSVTATNTDRVNYLGDTEGRLDLNLVDVVLNGSRRFDNGLRVGAQLYAYQVGDYRDLVIDWATLDYSFAPAFGVRAGRYKVVLGLYNDSQDLDSVRTFASLPFGFYPKTLRAITSSLDGVALYGNVGLGGAGNLDYQVHGGVKEDIDGDSPLVQGFNGLARYDELKVRNGAFGASLFWNTPAEGLKFGVSYFVSEENELPGRLQEKDQLQGTFLTLAQTVDYLQGSGAWDHSGLFAGTPMVTVAKNEYLVASAEYTFGKWLFAFEYKLQDTTDGESVVPALALLGMPSSIPIEDYSEQYYGMVTYQATDKLGLGLYYCEEDLDRKNRTPGSVAALYTKDLSLAVSYALNDHWVCKAEAHSLKGHSLVHGSGDAGFTMPSKARWTAIVLKTSFTF